MAATQRERSGINRVKKPRKTIRVGVSKKRSSWQCTVYAIVDFHGTIKYIGQTRSTAKRRFQKHIEEPSGLIGAWLRTEIKAGRMPEVKVITTRGVWDVSEVIWIERCRAAGIELLNRALGGKCKNRKRTVSKTEAHFLRTGEIVFYQ